MTGAQPEPVLHRHADHDPSLICRPALGRGLCEVLETGRAVEVIPCAGIPYTCDGFDPADWPADEVPDFTPIREWEARVRDE